MAITGPGQAAGRAVLAVVFSLLLGGCASSAAEPKAAEPVALNADTGDDIEIDANVVSYDEYHDPLMPLNRFVFGFNDIVARYVLVPAGKGYTRIMPDPAEESVSNFFSNIASPIYAVNNLLQGRFEDSGRNVARFGINTTIGLLGLFDPARDWFELEPAKTDFAATLAHHDVGYGTYLVLPFFGPSDLRNAAGRGVDYFLHPVPYLLDNPESFLLMSYGFFHDFAQNAEAYEKLLRESEDPYIFMRNLHLQRIQRDAAYRK